MTGRDRKRFSIIMAQRGSGLDAARSPFKEYADSLEFDLDFQDFDRELAYLPGAYAEPKGRLLLATIDGESAGCIALRPLSPLVCEMKRLYVRPGFRQSGLGRVLVETLIQNAHTIGYTRMRLDTSPYMAAASRLYKTFGFVNIPPYCFNPIEGATYMELKLKR